MRYAITISEPDQNGNRLVTVPAIPEALTQGSSFEECREMALDAIETSFDFYKEGNKLFPLMAPNFGTYELGNYEHSVVVPEPLLSKIVCHNTTIISAVTDLRLKAGFIHTHFLQAIKTPIQNLLREIWLNLEDRFRYFINNEGFAIILQNGEENPTLLCTFRFIQKDGYAYPDNCLLWEIELTDDSDWPKRPAKYKKPADFKLRIKDGALDTNFFWFNEGGARGKPVTLANPFIIDDLVRRKSL